MGRSVWRHVIASAIVDRIIHHCEIIKITGQSYRIKGKIDLTKINE